MDGLNLIKEKRNLNFSKNLPIRKLFPPLEISKFLNINKLI